MKARAAAARAFMTSPGGTAYGAAVLTVSGNVYQAGQYSSFNHMTNVHAEQAALVLAVMADDPDVLALAVASTGIESVTRPCGVCRQVFAEHVARVGRDFEVLMACRNSDSYEVAQVSELLPFSWVSNQAGAIEQAPDIRGILSQSGSVPAGQPLQAGDHVVLRDGSIALVWDGAFEPDRALVKVKYIPTDGKLRKVPHSLAEPLQYQKEMHDFGQIRRARCGVGGAFVGEADITAVFKMLPLGGALGEPPGPLVNLLRDAGVDVSAVRVTGSRAIGLQRANSDWDLVVPLEVEPLSIVRDALATAVERGVLTVPPRSGTWKLLDRVFPGGREALLRSRRFVDTLLSGEVSIALIFVPPQSPDVCVGLDWQGVGRTLLYGQVVDAAKAVYKRAEYHLQDEEGLVRVTCYHKLANLLRSGDVISASGWLFRRGMERRLIQILPYPDRIIWWRVA
ncbi:MAG: hypothetical protein WHU94_07265 [Thermogemmata sp.]|uniref:CMP/dCMP-type deaminase domain-containing protein n=1 Tax=Thermogemmata fonticola TaxID=2755323 RepID=A0A7V8VEV0_9BACT|nr:hypothetical protein [Thermogemmata fonticola]MBA2226676.1 hypothetical protein [Thermogemmata fonticola]